MNIDEVVRKIQIEVELWESKTKKNSNDIYPSALPQP
jgi:hypothetical protein